MVGNRFSPVNRGRLTSLYIRRVSVSFSTFGTYPFISHGDTTLVLRPVQVSGSFILIVIGIESTRTDPSRWPCRLRLVMSLSNNDSNSKFIVSSLQTNRIEPSSQVVDWSHSSHVIPITARFSIWDSFSLLKSLVGSYTYTRQTNCRSYRWS